MLNHSIALKYNMYFVLETVRCNITLYVYVHDIVHVCAFTSASFSCSVRCDDPSPPAPAPAAALAADDEEGCLFHEARR